MLRRDNIAAVSPAAADVLARTRDPAGTLAAMADVLVRDGFLPPTVAVAAAVPRDAALPQFDPATAEGETANAVLDYVAAVLATGLAAGGYDD